MLSKWASLPGVLCFVSPDNGEKIILLKKITTRGVAEMKSFNFEQLKKIQLGSGHQMSEYSGDLNNRLVWYSNVTQSKSTDVITRRLCLLDLIVFTDNYLRTRQHYIVHEIHYITTVSFSKDRLVIKKPYNCYFTSYGTIAYIIQRVNL